MVFIFLLSLIEFAKGSNYAMRMVDGILDAITHGEHSKTINVIEERRKIEAEEAEIRRQEEEYAKCIAEESNFLERLGFPTTDVKPFGKDEVTVKNEVDDSKINFDSLKSLNDLGIEVGFLEELKNNVDAG